MAHKYWNLDTDTDDLYTDRNIEIHLFTKNALFFAIIIVTTLDEQNVSIIKQL